MLLLNALGKNISQDDILDYFYNGTKSSKIIELIEKLNKISDEEEFKSEVLVLLYCESDEAKKEIIFDEKMVSKFDSYDIVQIISSMESDEIKKECLFDEEVKSKLDSENIANIIYSMKMEEVNKECLLDRTIRKKLINMIL